MQRIGNQIPKIALTPRVSTCCRTRLLAEESSYSRSASSLSKIESKAAAAVRRLSREDPRCTRQSPLSPPSANSCLRSTIATKKGVLQLVTTLPYYDELWNCY
jgi:hypothetical protein